MLPRFISVQKQNPQVQNFRFVYIYKYGITSDYDSFQFLNETYQLSKVGWDDNAIPKLWRYNLHYFDFLRQEAESSEVLELQKKVIEDWIVGNPFGKGSAWEPYPTSLRIINWIKWHWKTDSLTEEAKISLWNQVRWLVARPEFHLLGNHLFVNAKALLFASVFYHFDEKSNIYRKALKILSEELDEQFLSDGAQFELSPMYHALAMEDLLDLYQLTSGLSQSFPSQKILDKYVAGINWLSLMKYDNDELSHFNDCANGIAPTFTELEDLSKKIGIKRTTKSLTKFNHFEQSGFALYKDENIHLIADIGHIGPDYLPGHAHADSLSFELTIKGHRVIVNSGTSEYGLSNERLRQRSTAAHSTVEIDGQSSSEVWSGFRVARRARIKDLKITQGQESIEFTASHNGYKRLLNKPNHKRSWKLTDGKLDIIDEVMGLQNAVTLRFYIHPDILVEKTKGGIVFSTSSSVLAKMTTTHSTEVLPSSYHDRFGESRFNQCVLIHGNALFTSEVSIIWNK